MEEDELFNVIRQDDRNRLHLLFEKGVDVNSVSSNGEHLLHIAAKKCSVKTIKMLIDLGAEINCLDNDNLTPLHRAIERDDELVIKTFVSCGANMTDQNNSDTLLLFAVSNASLNGVKILLSVGADVNKENSDGNTALMMAINIQNYSGSREKQQLNEIKLEIIRLLSKNGCNINKPDKLGNTPLHMSVKRNKIELAQCLLGLGSDINLQNNLGESCLHIAVSNRYHLLVDLFIENQAKLDISDYRGHTPLCVAAELGYEKLIDRLIDAGANVHHKTNSDLSLLYLALQKCKELAVKLKDTGVNITNGDMIHAVRHGNEIQMELLKDFGGNLDVKDLSGGTLLHLAAESGNMAVVDWILNYSPDVDARDWSEGYTVLHCAARGGNVNIIERVKSLYDVNVDTLDGRTPLHIAASKGQFSAMQLFLRLGADINLTDRNGWNVLHFAAEGGSEDVINTVIPYFNINTNTRDGRTPLHVAATYGKLSAVQLLLEHGADINLTDELGANVLHYASYGGKEDLIYLVKCNFDINVKTHDGQTPLHLAASNGQFPAVQLLLEHGADINVINDVGENILHYAARGGNKDIINLVMSSFNINEITFHGKTPLHVAASNGHFSAVQLLLILGADVNLLDVDGWNVLHYAAFGGSADVTDLVISAFDVNIKLPDGRTPLHIAASNSKLSPVKVLLEHGADVNLTDGNGWNVLHHAACGGSGHIINLVKPYFDINVKTNQGQTPLDIAEMYGPQAAAQLLYNLGGEINLIVGAED